MLSVLRFDYARDTNGKRIEIVPEFTPGIQTYVYDNSHARILTDFRVQRSLKPFPCTFKCVNRAREDHLRTMMTSNSK